MIREGVTVAIFALALALCCAPLASAQSSCSPTCEKFDPCVNSSDCATDPGCVPMVNICIEQEYSQFLVGVYSIILAALAGMLLSCILWEWRKRCQAYCSARSRARKKAKQAAAKNADYDALEAITLSPRERADTVLSQAGEGRRQKYLSRLVSLYSLAKVHVGMVRQGAAVLNVNTTLLKDERAAAATQLRTLVHLLLDRGTMDTMEDEQVEAILLHMVEAEKLIGNALWKPSDVARAGQELLQAESTLENAAKQLAASSTHANAVLGMSVQEALKLEMADGRLAELQLRVELLLEHSEDEARRKAERVMLANTSFVSSKNVWDLVNTNSNRCWNCCTSTYRIVTPNFVRTYPVFYFLFFGGMIGIFFQFFDRVGAKNNAELQEGGLLGSTFLPVPPYYNLAKHEEQRFLIPLLYGIMHSALYCFCWLPVAFMRGVWRDVANWAPSLRRWIPIDDMVYFHKMLGVLILSFIFSGAIIWMTALGIQCRNNNDIQSCLAFDIPPEPGVDPRFNDINPWQNVLALRKLVFMTWFTLIPLIHWVRGDAPKYLPMAWMRKYWWEFAYYSHKFVAYLSFLTAMICRFDVFYLANIPWGLYFLDLFREIIFHTHGSYVVVRPTFSSQEDSAEDSTSVIHTDASEMPTSVKVLIDVPPGFKSEAGQHVYLNVPEVSRVQWHPFSLASGSTDNYVELQIGVIGNRDQWRQRNDDKVGQYTENLRKSATTGHIDQRKKSSWCCCCRSAEPAGPTLILPSHRIPPPKWKMVDRPTWTYGLQAVLRNRITQLAFLEDPERQADEVAPIRCYLKGPYGSTFKSCFDPNYTGVVIIGAGTGLTAALSVLRELISRKRAGKRVPKYVWFVWSCKRVDDLLWCWDTLHQLLVRSIEDGTIRPGKNWNRKSNMLDWIGVTIYVTQADKKKLAEFVGRAPRVGATQSIGRLLSLRAHNAEALAPAAKEVVDDVEVSKANRRASDNIGQHDSTGFFGGDQKGEEDEKLEDSRVVEPQSKDVVHRFHSLGIGAEKSQSRREMLSTEVQNWLTYDRHLLSSSMDDADAHINKLLAWARVYTNRKAGKNRKMTVCFCGPTGLAHLISGAARKIGSGTEFSADHQ